jgi:hypothetical protein
VASKVSAEKGATTLVSPEVQRREWRGKEIRRQSREQRGLRKSACAEEGLGGAVWRDSPPGSWRETPAPLRISLFASLLPSLFKKKKKVSLRRMGTGL